jgi:hypothetical protein
MLLLGSDGVQTFVNRRRLGRKCLQSLDLVDTADSHVEVTAVSIR